MIKIVFIIFSIIIIAVVALLFLFGVMSKSGNAPGLVEGRLSKCSSKSNCVCSEYRNDTLHFVEPIISSKNSTVGTLILLKNIINEMGGSIQFESDHYIAATFSSAIFGFVDDLEVRLDVDQKIIHIRSSSRVGHSDYGVNKTRIELLKKHYDAK